MTRHSLIPLLGAAALSTFLVACDADSDDGGGSGADSGGQVDDDDGSPTETEGSSTPDPSGTTDGPDPSGTTAPDPDPDTDSSDTDSSDTEDTNSFIDDPDTDGGVSVECDVWSDDCPGGQKCMPWANDGGNSWNATRCSPIDDNPAQIGDPCSVEGSGVSGIDTCDSRSMCYYVDSETNEGVCVGFCEGTQMAPSCDSGFICTIVNDGVLTLCRPECDPLLQDCQGSAACLPATGAQGFTCIIDASGEAGASGDPCEFINACDPGLYCASAEVVPDCAGATGCCTAFCDIGDDECTNVETECVPYFEEGSAPPGYETVGACAIPQ